MAQALNCSMITLRIDFAAEHPIRPPRVGKDHGNQNRRTAQHEYLARFGCGRIPNGQASGDDIWPHCNRQSHHLQSELGRASCRERVCLYVLISLVAVSFKKTTKNKENKT